MDNPTPDDVSQCIQSLKELKEILIVGNPWLPLYSAIAGGFIASIPTGLGALWRRRQTRKAVEAALLTEISNIAAVIKKRKIVEELSGKLYDLTVNNLDVALTRRGSQDSSPYQFNVADTHFKIYEANLDNLGLLDKKKLPKIVHFYGLIESLIQDAKPNGGLGGHGTQYHYAEFIRLLEEALKLADELSPPKT